MDWQPISTALKPNVVIWLGMVDHRRLGYWQDGIEHENFGTSGGGWIDYCLAEAGRGPRGLRFAPTHWLPLPPPPKDTTHDQS